MKAFFKPSKRLTVSVVGHNDLAKKIHARRRVTTSPSLQARQSSLTPSAATVEKLNNANQIQEVYQLV